MPREQLKSEMGLASNVFDALISRMAAGDVLIETGAKLHLSGHAVQFTQNQQTQIKSLLKAFHSSPYSPPSVKQCAEEIGEPLLQALIETGQLIQLSEDVLFEHAVYEEMQTAVIDHIKEYGSITLAELRDKFDTSRKYAVAVLEYLDQTGVTLRRDDKRVLRRPR